MQRPLIAMAIEVGAEPDAARAALAAFSGVGRRYELRGLANGVTYIDDYAHNPGKVRATLATAGNGGWGRVVAVFQPHRYSRTATLFRDFADAFDGADLVVVTGLYSAGEQPAARRQRTARWRTPSERRTQLSLSSTPRRVPSWSQCWSGCSVPATFA